MTLPNLWGAPEWWPLVLVLCGLLLVGLFWSYRMSQISLSLKMLLIGLKSTGFVLLALCLLEPMRTESRPQIGANTLVVAVDASRSMNIRDASSKATRAEQVRRLLLENRNWLDQLREDYDLRQYQFGSRLDSVNHFDGYLPNEQSSSLRSTLHTIGQRYQSHAMAGVILLTDGLSTEEFENAFDWSSLPPIYPVVIGGENVQRDIRIVRTTVNESNFETAPVSLAVELIATGFAGQVIEVQLLNDDDLEVDRRTIRNVQDGRPFAVRFDVRPEKRGLTAYTVRAFGTGNQDLADDSEATVVNNQRQVIVDRARGPYRILYVSGRPNWEFKFMRRSLNLDDELKLIGLIRIANREPKFTFRSQIGASTNPLYRGFGNQKDEEAERYDEAVLLRIGVEDETQLLSGFPKSADELFKFDAIVLDDVEAAFFSQDQHSLMQQFVAARGGGLLMLGGQESFVKGEYDRTSIGEMLPVYVDQFTPSQREEDYRLELTREGWVEPWIRVRATEKEEEQRLETMPPFKTINRVNSIKPGASVLAKVSTSSGQQLPALVEQRFGQGRVAALLLGDFWRWHLKNERGNDDLMKAWRQMIRWLVANVPRRVELTIERQSGSEQVRFRLRVKDEGFAPLDNATARLTIIQPDNEVFELVAEPSGRIAGEYTADFMPAQTGLNRVTAEVSDHQQNVIGTQESGWIAQPEIEEFAQVIPNRELLKQIAERTGGEVINANQLSAFVDSLGNRQIPFTEQNIYPWWHHWSLFVTALALLIAEWGIRRWKGLT